MQSEMVDRFISFIVAERELYNSHNNNRVAISLGQIGRYLQFVEITRSRYILASKEVAEQFRKRVEEARQKSGKRKLTPAEIADREKEGQLQQLLDFEIESFFLFSKILLDKTAHFIGDYFGQAHGISFRSHDKLCKGIAVYSKEKQLQLPEEMKDIMVELRSLVVDYRDKQITHLQNSRALYITYIDANGGAQIGTSALYPHQNDKHSASPPIEHVFSTIDAYMIQLEMLIKMNRVKSRYKLLADDQQKAKQLV